jgi:hypothetical protein
MKKIIFLFLILIIVANLILLIIALTDKSSEFYNYRLVIGISFIMFGGFLRHHFLSNNKNY